MDYQSLNSKNGNLYKKKGEGGLILSLKQSSYSATYGTPASKFEDKAQSYRSH